MKVLNVEKLHSFSRKHNQAKGALDSWYDEVKRDEWKTSQDIRDRYNSVSFLHDNRVIFNIKVITTALLSRLFTVQELS